LYSSLSSSFLTLALFPICVYQSRPICGSGLLGNEIYTRLMLCVVTNQQNSLCRLLLTNVSIRNGV
jgi:hypothetical protein